MVITKFHKPIVSVNWLNENLNATNLVVLDASIPNVSESNETANEFCIPNARFFDLKQKFSDTSAPFPNTMPSKEQFEEEAQKLGVNKSSFIVVYDDKGIYSSPRAWWLFRVFGFNNIAVLDGGLPAWTEAYLPLNKKECYNGTKGDFIALEPNNSMLFFNDIQRIEANNSCQIVDARSENRFKGIVAEPRKGLHSGRIPNSINLPYTELLNKGRLKSESEIKSIFSTIIKNKPLVFSCGSGITACILALAADLLGFNNVSVYDGSWTEYGTLTHSRDMENIENWSKEELVAYILLYAANSNLSETNKERDVILNKVDMQTFQKVYDEFNSDNDYQCIQKIIKGLETHDYSKTDLKQLFLDMKVLFFADGEFDQVEHTIYNWLKRILE